MPTRCTRTGKRTITIVQWDQRGTGKTWQRKPLPEDAVLTVERLRDDGIEVARYAARRFGKKRKVILMGGSWSSALGTYMAKASPAAFCAFVTTAQLVKGAGQPDSYAATLSQARAAGDKESVDKLEKLGVPPWTDPRSPGVMRRVMRKYEAMSTEPAPKAWWKPAPGYDTPEYEAAYEAGEDYSWLQYRRPARRRHGLEDRFIQAGAEVRHPHLHGARRAGLAHHAGAEQALLRQHPGAGQGIRAGRAHRPRSEPADAGGAVPAAQGESGRLPLISGRGGPAIRPAPPWLLRVRA
jgi:hypothetical protein